MWGILNPLRFANFAISANSPKRNRTSNRCLEGIGYIHLTMGPSSTLRRHESGEESHHEDAQGKAAQPLHSHDGKKQKGNQRHNANAGKFF
jgi:hypothetical protein